MTADGGARGRDTANSPTADGPAPVRSGPERAAPERPARDDRIDVVAGVLIVLVVLGHAMLVVPGPAARAAELWIYMFHMPAFVFLSGYLTRYSRAWSVGALVARLLFPLVVFQVLHRLLIAYLTDDAFSLDFPGISWTLWYLAALLVWRLAAIVLMQTPWTVAISVALSLAAGLVPAIGYDYSLSRILGFLPFFTAGLFWRAEWNQVLARWWWAGAALLLAAAAWVLTAGADQSVNPFHMARSYERLGVGPGEGLAGRALILAVSALLVASVIAVCYRRVPGVSSIGRGTLAVYLLHPLVLMPWYVTGTPLGMAGVPAVIVLAVASLVFAWLASRPVVGRWLAPLSDFTWWSSRWRIGSPRDREWPRTRSPE
ncbi:acyltransferase family protein [Demequina sp. NBRC 110055]|uniref:acyltransferase family protein n=1 Tax=Demequina sp. NBRC 110055 TaxID=1570344 RepID=UPI0013564712|nr:acyltransferase family protein [Demequina sp. NBRC 110055]